LPWKTCHDKAMSVITYTAHSRADLISGHTAGNQYQFEIPFMAFDRSFNSPKAQYQSLSGAVETVLQRLDQTYSAVIGPYDITDQDQVQEFIQSVANGETFSIDIYGTIASPVADIDVKLRGSSNTEQRYGARLFTLPFNLFKV